MLECQYALSDTTMKMLQVTQQPKQNRNTIEWGGEGGSRERLQRSRLSVRSVRMQRAKIGGGPSPPSSAASEPKELELSDNPPCK